MRYVALSLCCVLLVSGAVWGQATAQIAGTVHDETRAVIRHRGKGDPDRDGR